MPTQASASSVQSKTREGDIQRFERRFEVQEEFGDEDLLPLLRRSLGDLRKSAYGCLQ